ncbi:MAG: hypothetical protein ACK559_41130, partial [bacterium]
VDRGGDVHLHLGGRVSSAPHHSPQVLCQWLGVDPLVELRQVLGEGVLMLSDPQGYCEQVDQR